MEHLISKRIIQASIKSPALAEKISTTVAHLLSFEVSLQKTISRDLVNFCFDLSVIQEGKLFDSNNTVRVALFTETVGGSDYCLDITSTEAVHVLQASAMKLVLEFASHHMSQRLDTNLDVSKVPASMTARRNADARLDSVLRDSDLLSTLLASVRQILLSPLPQNTKAFAFSLRAKICALELLSALVLEWQQIGATTNDCLHEVTLIFAATFRWYFTSFDKLFDYRERLTGLLQNLLHDTVLFAPLTRGGLHEDQTQIRSLILPSLLDCIGEMSCVLQKGDDSETELCDLILQSVDILMSKDAANLVEMATHHCTTNGVFPNLFKLLGAPNAGIRVTTIKILHTFLESKGQQHTFTVLSTACRFAMPSAEQQHESSTLSTKSETNPLQDTTPHTPFPSTGKRKVVSLSSKGRSPRKLEFEPSPKRKRSDAKLATPSPEQHSYPSEIPIEDALSNVPVSLSDSCKLFLTETVRNAKRIRGLCRQRPCGLNPVGGDIESLFCKLSVCSSAIFLLLPMILCEKLSEHQHWISEAAAIMFDALAEVSVVIDTACQGVPQTNETASECLAKVVEVIVDVGLVSHFAMLRSKNKERSMIDGSISKFLVESSRCAWDAMSRFSVVASPRSEEVHSWRRFCQHCSFFMRFLNIQETRCRPCLCTLRRSTEVSSGDVNDGVDIGASGLPAPIKLVAYSLARPCFSVNNAIPTKVDRQEIHRMCKPALQKCEQLIQASLCATNDSVSLFSVAFMALLPSLVLAWTQKVFQSLQDGETSREDRSKVLDDVYRIVCASFPHEKLSVITKQMNISPRLRMGVLIGIQHYRSLIRSIEWKDCASMRVSVAFQLAYFSREGFSKKDGVPDQEPHHSLSSIDRSLRLSLLSMSCDADDKMSAVDRIRKWRLVKEVVLQASVAELSSMPKVQSGFVDPVQNQNVLKMPSVLVNMLSVPFADMDYQVRLSLSRDLGEFLLQRNGHVLLSTFGSCDIEAANGDRTDDSTSVGTTISFLFQEIDRLLFHHSCMPQSQLSSTFTTTSASEEYRNSAEIAAEYQHTALRAIASLCQYSELDNPYGHVIFEHALLRLVRFWATSDHCTDENERESSGSPVSALSFSEIRRLTSICDFSKLSSGKSQRTFIPALFSEVLLPAAGSLADETGKKGFGRDLQQRQNHCLYSFLESFVLSNPDEKSPSGTNGKLRLLHGSVSPCIIANFVDESLCFAIPSMVIEKDYDAIRLATGFKLFVLGMHHSNSSGDNGDSLVGVSIRALTSRALGTTKSRHGLEEQTKLLCLQPKMTQHILPRLLIDNTDRSQLVFFLHVVLQKKMAFKELISSSDKTILKEIIWELGGSSHVDQQSIQALKVAALARERVAKDDEDQDFSGPNLHKIDAHSIASTWVSSHFMFLLVNIVQLKWQEKPLDDKIRALRSLNLMLKFLLPSEAPRFLTQMVATVSTATSQEKTFAELACHGAKLWLLRSLAARNLATYIEIMVHGHLETIGRNLATIVVSLFPVLVLPENRTKEDLEELRIRTEAGEVAAGILEVFTSGKVGKELSQYFKEIPFLPSTPLLDKTKENLKANGVDFDRLLVLSSTQTTQRVLSGKDSMTTDGGTSEKEDSLPRVNANLISALQNRLRVVRPLLSQESASVRLVALQHVIDLLRANRVLFYRLIEKEDPSTTTSVLTVQYNSKENYETRGAVTALVEALLSRASAENNRKVKSLLGKCLGEVAAIDPHRLGTISTTNHKNDRKGTLSSSVDGRSWQLSHPPWQSSTSEYALHLLTKLLVNALKAASNSAEQHKVAHTIQQLLVILDKTSNDTIQPEGYDRINVRTLEGVSHSSQEKGPMSQWLSDNLESEGVLSILEPYWASSFSENTSSRNTKLPPFYRTAENYFQWMSRWCRYLILRAYENNSCTWRSLLFACRTVVRSLAGTVVSEFILPILVLELLCFGSPDDEEVIQRELRDVFELSVQPSSDDSSLVRMSFSERQKAVNTAFLLVDTLKLWSERETEGFFKRNTKQGTQGSKLLPISFNSGSSNATLALEKINDLIDTLPLETMSKTAAAMGMHARALLCLEAKARMGLAVPVFDTTKVQVGSSEESRIQLTVQHGLGAHLLRGINVSLLKEVLGNLDDYPTMKAVAGNSRSLLYDKDGIRERESRGDWTGALNDYERALQSQSDTVTRSSLEQASLRCLLEIGQYESVLNQVNGIMYRAKASNNEAQEEGAKQAIPLAIDAAWRLGRWSALDSLVDEYGSTAESANAVGGFQLAVGKAMLGLYRRSKSEVDDAVGVAREALMTKLSTVARDSYDRAYPSLVRLQCIREIEDANIVFSENLSMAIAGSSTLSDLATSADIGGWAWDCRLDMTSNVDSSIITDVRLALARLAGDTKLERDVFFTMGKKARKNGLLDVASTCFAQSRSVAAAAVSADIHSDTPIKWIGEVQMQLAKLEYQDGQTSSALRILGVEDVKGWSKLCENELRVESAARLQIITGRPTLGSDHSVRNDMAKRLLKSTRWIAEGGLKAVPEVMERFRVSNQLRPKWEKSHFEFGKYLDSLLEARIFGVAQHEGWSADDDNVRQYALSEDMNCQNYLLMAMEQYLEALKVNDKHVYQALPRVLSLWFEYTSVERHGARRGKAKKQGGGDSPVKLSSDPTVFLRNKQDEANQLFQEAASRIPSSMFYTATPQLISRLCHPNSHTALAVQTLLTRVLSKFPGQAMWALAWVRNSLDKTRSSIGNEIFKSAQKSIMGWATNNRRVESRRKMLLEKNRKILVASQSLVTYLIDIAKYLPKDERARSFKLGKWRGEVELCDFIPPVQTALSTPMDTTKERDPFPRFRAAHTGVQIMSSKAKPKRVTFYVVPGASGTLVSPGAASGPSTGDVGELHFLLKNEAKGDLRKDARVQDLNNVINRLMASAGKRKRQRRLRLRTFAVTCLSEDCGIVEWVPSTESFRSLSSKSYNPQAATYSVKRRGKRIANFGDPSLKKNFENCQHFFFKNGDLTTAARLFEVHFLNSFPPLFYWWFVQNFMDPHAWYEARTNFTTSAAVWSAVGHVIGLGDRHSENLLIDTSSGDCVHVDFDW